MQSGFGVSEMQQFMVDGICSPFFPVAAAATDMSQQQKNHQNQNQQEQHHNPYSHQQLQQHDPQQPQPQYHHHHQQFQQYPHPSTVSQLNQHQHHQQQQQQRFPHFHHPIPITQQLFHQTHHFHFFQQEQQRRVHHHLGLDQEPETSAASPPRIVGGGGGGDGIPSFLAPSMNFRLSVNESSGGDDCGGGILHGDEDGSESRLQAWQPPPTTPREEESAIKEPFWRPLDLDLDYINRNNKRCKDKQQQQELEVEGSSNKQFKPTNVVEDATNSGNNYKLFSELEAICKPGGTTTNNNQTGSSSALTGENPPTNPTDPNLNVDDRIAEPDPIDDTSTGEEASLKKTATTNNARKASKEKKRKRRKQQLSNIVAFFETLVKQLMEHQETLHRKFLEILEKRDQERIAMEEVWRQEEAARAAKEAKAREEEQALASAREAAIISFLEKITGESLNLPTKLSFKKTQHDDKEDDTTTTTTTNNNNQIQGVMNSNRWPKVEVQALIKVRSGLEKRFQEPGLKGPLWEEVSSAMASLGYHRSAKRCKEKWENINKYFRKTKESAKKRPQHSKTCPYFHQLDQLYYSKVASVAAPEMDQRGIGNSELLDAIVVSTDQGGFKFSDMMQSAGPVEGLLELQRGCINQDDRNDNVDCDEEKGDGRGRSPTDGRGGGDQEDVDEEENRSHEPTLFFPRIGT